MTTDVEVVQGALTPPQFDDSEIRELSDEVQLIPPITSERDAGEVAAYIHKIHAFRDKVHDVYDGLAKMANDLHKRITGDRSKELAKSEMPLQVCNRLIANWEAEKERRRREEQARLEREAREAAEREQAERAMEAFEGGDSDEAAAIMEQPPEPPAAVTVPKERSNTGLGVRKMYSAELTDGRPTEQYPQGRSVEMWDTDTLIAVIKLAAEGKISPHFLAPNLRYADAQAKALKQDFRAPGFRVVVKTPVVRQGGRRF